MDYDTARKLEEAGFPQQGLWGYVDLPEKTTTSKNGVVFTRKAEVRLFPWHRNSNFKKSNYYRCLAPTLSELINACGDKFLSVKKTPNGFIATSTQFAEAVSGIAHEFRKGSTIEEAVAHLWLALNEK